MMAAALLLAALVVVSFLAQGVWTKAATNELDREPAEI
jgi:hypothetical protein